MPTITTPGITVYTFTANGTTVQFIRRRSGTIDGWFGVKPSYTKDSILPSGTTGGGVIIDFGAYDYKPLQITAELPSAVARATLKSLATYAGTLSNTKGRSASAVLTVADEPDEGDGTFLLECTFEKFS